jgi:hypothetical protein
MDLDVGATLRIFQRCRLQTKNKLRREIGVIKGVAHLDIVGHMPQEFQPLFLSQHRVPK